MAAPSTLRETLLVEALGEAAHLLRQVEELGPALEQSRQALLRADSDLRRSLATFEDRLTAITENAKTRTVQFVVTRVEEAARRTIEQQTRAMTAAAEDAFNAQLNPALQRLQLALRELVNRANKRWEACLTHAAVAVAASSITWVLTIWVVPR